MDFDDILSSEGILPYPTEFPNETDVISALNDEIFDLANVGGYATGQDAISEIEKFESVITADTQGEDFPPLASTSSDTFNQPSVKTQNSASTATGWNSVSYAYGLANSQFRPKLRFMFYVDFLLKSEFSELANEKWARNMSFMAKAVDRPKLTVEYEEINQYNFRTKVMKSSKYDDGSITFYDDSDNSVLDFFRFVLTLIHPITRRSNSMSSDLSTGDFTLLTGHGMSFSGDNYDTNDFSHRGVINTDNGQVFQVIKVTQTYVVPTGEQSARQISYLYVNPMITSIEMSELSSEDSSNTCEITLKFSYDAVIVPNTEELQDPRNPMPPVGNIPSDYSIAAGTKFTGFSPNKASNFNVGGELPTSIFRTASSPSSGGYLASSFIPGLSSQVNLNLGGGTGNDPMNQVQQLWMNEARRQITKTLPPEARRSLMIAENVTKAIGSNDPNQLSNLVISEATQYGSKFLSSDAARTVGLVAASFRILNRPTVGSRTTIPQNKLLNDDSSPDSEITGIKF